MSMKTNLKKLDIDAKRTLVLNKTSGFGVDKKVCMNLRSIQHFKKANLNLKKLHTP